MVRMKRQLRWHRGRATSLTIGEGEASYGEEIGLERRAEKYPDRPVAGTPNRQGGLPMPGRESCPMDERVKFIAAYSTWIA